MKGAPLRQVANTEPTTSSAGALAPIATRTNPGTTTTSVTHTALQPSHTAIPQYRNHRPIVACTDSFAVVLRPRYSSHSAYTDAAYTTAATGNIRSPIAPLDTCVTSAAILIP